MKLAAVRKERKWADHGALRKADGEFVRLPSGGAFPRAIQPYYG
jgi:hypothetical protein